MVTDVVVGQCHICKGALTCIPDLNVSPGGICVLVGEVHAPQAAIWSSNFLQAGGMWHVCVDAARMVASQASAEDSIRREVLLKGKPCSMSASSGDTSIPFHGNKGS
jgi:hypothetical protein